MTVLKAEWTKTPGIGGGPGRWVLMVTYRRVFGGRVETVLLCSDSVGLGS